MLSTSTKKKLLNPVAEEFIPKAVVGYKRVSFIEDDKKNSERTDSLDVQDQLIRNYAKQKGLPVRHMYCDPGISGYDDSNRPKFLAMKDEIEQGDIICVYDFSRVARNLKHLLIFLDEIHAKGARFTTCTIDIDTTTIHGMYVTQIMGATHEFERHLTAKKIKASMAHRKKSGKPVSKPVFGFMKDPNGEKGDPYIINPKEYEIVQKIIEMYKEGGTITGIARQLTRDGVQHKKTKTWQPCYVRTVLMYHYPPYKDI